MYDDAPLYVELTLIAMYVLLAATLGVTLWAAIHGMKTRGNRLLTLEVAHERWVTWGAVALPVLLLGLTFLLGSAEPLRVNGQLFTDTLWLRASDMFIYTSVLLIVLCFVIVIAARFRR